MFASNLGKHKVFKKENIFWLSMFLSSQKFVRVTAKLRGNKKLVDAQVVLEDGSIHNVHKFLLARGSIFFRKLFTHQYQEGTQYVLTMIAEVDFVRVLDWIYTVSLYWTKSEFISINNFLI